LPDAFYAERPADRELPAALLRGELCWVLGPPQVGKTSLRLRAQERLEKSGRLCAAIDLGLLGTHLAEENWYRGLLEEIAAQLGLRARIEDFWQQQGKLAPVHRFSRFLRERLPSLCDRPVVLFFDEIEATLALPFPAGDFFESLRALHSAKPARRRVTCCLLGVADPGDLAADPGRSPFHAGRGLRLEDLSPAEAEALLPGLRAAAPASAEELLQAVLSVTDGHPYMTQRLCEALAQQGPQGQPPAERVAALVQAVFLQDGRTEDASLVYAERRFGADKSVPAAERLQLYRRLLAGEAVRAVPEDPAQAALRLCGLAAVRRDAGGSWLRVRNRVFARVFDAAWVGEREAELDRPIAAPLRRFLEGGKRPEFLLRGPALAQVRAWAAGRSDVNAAERDFLIASLEAARGEDREAARRRHTTLLLPLSVALVLLVGLVLSLGVGERRAKERALAAEEAMRRGCPGSGQEEPGLASRVGRPGDLERAEAEAAAAREREARAVADAQSAAAALRETRAALDRAQEELRNKHVIQVTPLGQQGAQPPPPPAQPAVVPPPRPVVAAVAAGKPAQQPTPPPPAPPKPQPPAPPKPQPPAPPKPQPPPPQKPPIVPPKPQPVLAAAVPSARPAPPPVAKPAPPVAKPAVLVAKPAPPVAKPAAPPPAGDFCAAEKAKGPAASGKLLRDAMSHQGRGDHGQAVKLAECALRIRQAGKSRAEHLEALDTLGLIYYQAGNYARAEGYYRLSLQMRQAQDPGSPEVDSTLRILRLIAQKKR
jgi:tetratricopeptide (TPR) repeat protein